MNGLKLLEAFGYAIAIMGGVAIIIGFISLMVKLSMKWALVIALPILFMCLILIAYLALVLK